VLRRDGSSVVTEMVGCLMRDELDRSFPSKIEKCKCKCSEMNFDKYM
jgi:hypothetical protein